MDDESSGWISADSMNFAHHQYYQMVALGKKAYAMGGIKKSSSSSHVATNTMERYDEDTNQWTYVASYPHYIYHHCMVADEETGRIWVLGGRVQTGTYQNETHDWSEVRYYQVFILFFGIHCIGDTKIPQTGVNKHLARYLAPEMAPKTSLLRDCQTSLQ